MYSILKLFTCIAFRTLKILSNNSFFIAEGVDDYASAEGSLTKGASSVHTDRAGEHPLHDWPGFHGQLLSLVQGPAQEATWKEHFFGVLNPFQ